MVVIPGIFGHLLELSRVNRLVLEGFGTEDGLVWLLLAPHMVRVDQTVHHESGLVVHLIARE